MLGQKGSWNTQVIPDSEEEKLDAYKVEKVTFGEVVEISGSTDEDVKPDLSDGKSSGLWNHRPRQKTPHVPSAKPPLSSPQKGYGGNYMRSRVIESSDSESEEQLPRPSTHVRLPQLSQTKDEKEQSPTNRKRRPNFLFLKKATTSLIVEVHTDSENDDHAILVFDEPKSARKPKRLPPADVSVAIGVSATPVRSPSKSRHLFGPLQPAGIVKSDIEPSELPAVPAPALPTKKAPGTSRNTSKRRKDDQQAKLHTYAASFFEELNKTVFKNELPEDTKLNWNKRLLTTAGRAKWHRSRDGVQTSEIELAEKILTSYERIRNTLSHEMCHLASWVIDKEIKEAHGKFWKAWTKRVMAKYPDIDISTRHDYEIEYPYTWKCAQCDKTYGRFSKSIKPDECVCGACREGRLIPQFKTNTRTPKTPRTPQMSRMAAAKSQGSPFTPTTRGSPLVSRKEIISISSDSEDDLGPRHTRSRASICEIVSDSDSEIEVLAMTLGSTSIV